MREKNSFYFFSKEPRDPEVLRIKAWKFYSIYQPMEASEEKEGGIALVLGFISEAVNLARVAFANQPEKVADFLKTKATFLHGFKRHDAALACKEEAQALENHQPVFQESELTSPQLK